jgi:hypothetical protein
MSITVNVTEGNKVTVHRQDPISVSLNTTVNNEVTIQKTPPVSITVNRQEGSKINITQQANVSVGIQRQDPISISIDEPGKSSSVTTWGSIAGTITNQTDLVNYITSRLPDVPFETIQEILDAMNDLSSIDFTAPVKIFGTNTAGDPISFTIPAPLEQFESGTPYVMVVAPDGTVQWREIGLEYISGTNNLTFGGGAVQ